MNLKLLAAYLYNRRGPSFKNGWNCPPLSALINARHDLAAGKERQAPTLDDSGRGWNPESNGARYVEDLAHAGLRFVGHADVIVRLGHQGYFADDMQETTFRGAVLRLPGKDGRARYMAAYEDPNIEDAYIVDVSAPAIFEDDDDRAAQVEAARAADGFAERCAEKEREYHEAWRAGSDYATLMEQAADATKERRKLARDLRAVKRAADAAEVKVPPTICNALKARMRDLAEQAARATSEASKILENTHTRFAAAFNEGASAEVMS